MGYAKADAPPTWYRLSDESWAEIRRDYQDGATARELASRWRVAASSIYRRSREGGWGKKSGSDALARENVRAIEAEEQADGEAAWPGTKGPRTPLRPGALAALFEAGPDEEAVSAADLSHTAVQAAGRAMRQGLLAEAQTLARLAEALGRVAVRAPDSTLETIYRAVTDPKFVLEHMGIWGEDNPDPIKKRYWDWLAIRDGAGGGLYGTGG